MVFRKCWKRLAPVTFINIEREDKIAQAVSLARSLQTGTWTAGSNKPRPTVTYDRDLISRCLGSLEAQKLGWARWFEANRLIHMSSPMRNWPRILPAWFPASSNLSALKTMSLTRFKRAPSSGRATERTKSGLVRFKSEIQGRREKPAAPLKRSKRECDFRRTGIRDLLNRLHISLTAMTGSNSPRQKIDKGGLGVFAKKRRRDRYEAIIGRNRELFQNARVLDVQCGGGIWSLAALDAGAAHVVGVDSRKKPIETAKRTFGKYGVEPQFVRIGQGEGVRGIENPSTPAHSI